MATGKAKRFVELGVAPALAVEMAAQITASTGNKRRLIELGLQGREASIMAAAGAVHTVSKTKLCEVGGIPRVVIEFATQIAS